MDGDMRGEQSVNHDQFPLREISDDDLERAAGCKWKAENASPTFMTWVFAVCCDW